LHDYLKDYLSLAQVLEHYGAVIGSAGPYLDSVRARVREATCGLTEERYKAQEITAAKHQSIAARFLKSADK
jgi:hypothetical protein